MTNRELDELICEKVMGLKVIRNETEVPLGWYREVGRDFLGEPRPILDVHTWNATFEKHRGIGFRCTPGYSTDLNEAFRVIEKIRTSTHLNAFSLYSPCDDSKDWFAGFEKKWPTRHTDSRFNLTNGETAARAICLCALKAIEETEK